MGWALKFLARTKENYRHFKKKAGEIKYLTYLFAKEDQTIRPP